jgi:hypothetical protein
MFALMMPGKRRFRLLYLFFTYIKRTHIIIFVSNFILNISILTLIFTYIFYLHGSSLNSTGNEPVYYGAKDIYVGAMLVVNGHHFELLEAAPGTVKFMKDHQGEYE